MNRRFLIVGGALSVLAGGAYFSLGQRAANAGPLHLDSTGFAAGGRDVVAYFNLPATSPLVGGVPGSRRFTANWRGGVFAFASAENRDAFVANSERFEPQFDGHCAWAAGQGYKAPASPDVWSIVDGKLFLNYSHDVRKRWEAGMASQISAANRHWVKLGTQPGSTGDAADYVPSQAPVP
jgi:hypothetical protein